MSEDNAELVRRATERFSAGEPELEVYSEDFQLVNLPDAPWQPSPGKKGLREWLDFTDEIADEWRLVLEEVRPLGPDKVLTTGKLCARFHASGISDELPLATLVTIADGKITRIEAHHTREQALEAAGE
jgi:hypothetical protein